MLDPKQYDSAAATDRFLKKFVEIPAQARAAIIHGVIEATLQASAKGDVLLHTGHSLQEFPGQESAGVNFIISGMVAMSTFYALQDMTQKLALVHQAQVEKEETGL